MDRTAKPSPPHPRHASPDRCRRDGWTLERQATFLTIIEKTGNVTAAAAAAGMNRASAYRFRERSDGRRFGDGWHLALARRCERLLQERLAKATLALARLAKVDKGHSVRPAISRRQSDKGDSFGRSAQQCENRQDRRLSAASAEALRALISAGRRGDGMGR